MKLPVRPGRRRGLVSVAMLVGLIILAAIAGGLIKLSLARRSLSRAEERRLQAACLADSGLGRAFAQIEANPAYSGETWELPADELGGRGSARVTITVLPPPADAAEGRPVVVVAEYFATSSQTVRLTRSVRLPLPTPNAR